MAFPNISTRTAARGTISCLEISRWLVVGRTSVGSSTRRSTPFHRTGGRAARRWSDCNTVILQYCNTAILQYCNELFAWEKEFAALSPEEWYKQRLERELPVLDGLLSWVDSISGSVVPKSALGKALHYLREQWSCLIRYLEDGRLKLNNNRA